MSGRGCDSRSNPATPLPPGGVGPMTIACLLANTYTAACRSVGVTPDDLGG
jgi:5,10-methylene-tetrahydrofolate dehydrogenase/methenyl tetrahydrofolate cyclohydrolase